MPALDPPSASSPRPDRGSSGTDRRSWHRRASRPVSWWMLALILAVVLHPLLPQSRWLLVHMVTLGLITTSIMIWGQHFAEALLKTRLGPASRPSQLRRIRLLTAGILVTCAGMLGTWPWVAAAGAAAVGCALLWFAASLGRQLHRALAPRFASVVRAYIGAACLLPVGAVLGALLAFSPGEPWQGRLLLAHQIVNVLGFVGLTVCATLVTLWPTILRTRVDPLLVRVHGAALATMGAGVVTALAAALLGLRLLGVIALAAYALAVATVLLGMVRGAVRSAQGPHRVALAWFPVLSIAAGMLWLAGVVLALDAMWLRAGDGPDAAARLAESAHALTAPIVVGFLLQVLLGAMSHLLPVTMGGGPRATSAALREMSRLAVPRVLVLDLVLLLFVLADSGTRAGTALFHGLTLGTADASGFGSVTRVLVSLLAFVALGSFLVLMLRGVLANLRERRAGASATETGDGNGNDNGSDSRNRSRSEAPAESASARPARPGLRPGRQNLPAEDPQVLARRRVGGALLGVGTVLGTLALGGSLDASGGTAGGAASQPAGGAGGGSGSVAPTGRTTRITVSMADMRFTPDRLEVPAGDRLVIDLRNEDESDVHDLVLEGGASSGRVQPGASTQLDAGVITRDLDGWCSIVGHRAMGMTLTVVAEGADTGRGTRAGAPQGGTAADPLAAVTADLTQGPSASSPVRDAALPGSSGRSQRVTLRVAESVQEIAPGVRMHAMTYGDRVVGPVLRSELGASLRVDLENRAGMGHSLDLHAGTVSPDEVMRTIAPGEHLTYTITTDHAGAWLYHCATMPMSVHVASGMLGALIVPPDGLAAADREYVLVQSDHYLVPDDGPGVHEVSPAKVAAGRPDFTVFNGHATQYADSPLEARVGERVRIWVLAGGPSRGISFHIVGAVLDTVFAEGEYLLHPDSATGGGAQTLHLGVSQGGFVETVFEHPGTYTAVNHDMADMERGARALVRVTR